MNTIKNHIILLLDWLYKPVKSYFNIETFRYAACGGSNMVFDLVLYFLFYHYVVDESIVDLGIIAISPHIAAFLLVFPITFLSGFLLGKYVTFTNSYLRGRIQLFRYGVTVAGSVLLNYILIKIFVEYCQFYPTISKLLTTFVVIGYSYFVQKHYTFKSPKLIKNH